MVFVFATVSFTNAKNYENNISNIIDKNESIEYVDCIELAFTVDSLMLGGIDYDTFATIVFSCEQQQQ